MTSDSRAARRREARDAHRQRLFEHDANYAVMVAWCEGTDEAVEEAKVLSHDKLVEMMGDARTGPVQWLIWEGDDARKGLAEMVASTDPGDMAIRDHYRRVRAHLREYGGRVVVAMAKGDRT